MIQIIDKKSCCGCGTCVQSCPQNCISLIEDSSGFSYPIVDRLSCVDCHLCEKVCPCLNQLTQKDPICCYGTKNEEESIRRQSSSGGFFSIIADYVLNHRGVVYGARFNQNWEVVHDFTETKDGLKEFRNSKYVQSNIGHMFKQVFEHLNNGRMVLFSGTPCQIAGLKRYLHKDFENLITVDVVCHGTPSPKVWREYFSCLDCKDVGAVCFKDKSTGWRNYSFTIRNIKGDIIFREKASENKYLMAFSRNLTLRPSCFNCPAKGGKSGSDITIADFWGIEHVLPHYDDDKGYNFICANTNKGLDIIGKLNISCHKTNYDVAKQYNSCIYRSSMEPTDYLSFWEKYNKDGIQTVFKLKKHQYSFMKRIINKIIR